MTPAQARERAEKMLGNVAHDRAPLAGLDAIDGLSFGDFIEQKYSPGSRRIVRGRRITHWLGWRAASGNGSTRT